MSIVAALIASSLRSSSIRSASAARSITLLDTLPSAAIEIFAHGHREHEPLGLAIFRDKRDRHLGGFCLLRGLFIVTLRPAICTSPLTSRSTPNSDSSSSRCPCPSRHTETDDLARPDIEAYGGKPVAPGRFRHEMIGASPSSGVCFGGNTLVYSRPIISSIT